MARFTKITSKTKAETKTKKVDEVDEIEEDEVTEEVTPKKASPAKKKFSKISKTKVEEPDEDEIEEDELEEPEDEDIDDEPEDEDIDDDEEDEDSDGIDDDEEPEDEDDEESDDEDEPEIDDDEEEDEEPVKPSKTVKKEVKKPSKTVKKEAKPAKKSSKKVTKNEDEEEATPTKKTTFGTVTADKLNSVTPVNFEKNYWLEEFEGEVIENSSVASREMFKDAIIASFKEDEYLEELMEGSTTRCRNLAAHVIDAINNAILRTIVNGKAADFGPFVVTGKLLPAAVNSNSHLTTVHGTATPNIKAPVVKFTLRTPKDFVNGYGFIDNVSSRSGASAPAELIKNGDEIVAGIAIEDNGIIKKNDIVYKDSTDAPRPATKAELAKAGLGEKKPAAKATKTVAKKKPAKK